MKVTINTYEYVISQDEHDGEPYISDSFEMGQREVSFRELVELFDDHYYLSSDEASFGYNDWATSQDDEDYRTGDRTYTTLHLVYGAYPKVARFWVRAMRFSRARQKARDLKARARWAA